MTTSIDPSVDELLLLQEKQYHIPNFVVTNVKPIGAERKIGQLTNSSTQLISQKQLGHPVNMDSMLKEDNNYLNSSETSSLYDYFHLSSTEQPILYPTKTELELLTDNSSQISNNYNYQQYALSPTQQQLHPSVITRPQTAKRIPQVYPTSRFSIPNSSHFNSKNPFVNISQQKRSIPPVFTTPLQCTRERFQVNSIGRPILRTNNYSHFSQVHSFKIRP
ncbi:unnamed protein product [Adineta steineri]|uniref:Uncharacterized protein n=1 Tax=Adineta steineri TaxID=433720 RepID=A0A815RUM3_9BILA|nr:unnamed protein product [Adineta steineri]CAF3898433.1 unnamed protein product [Adineta steineri]